MSDSTQPEKSLTSRLSEALADLHMESLTRLAKLLLPEGIWQGQGQTPAHEQHSTASVSGGIPEIHLTFDDGPNPATTPYLLELFQEEGVKATFFVIGNQVEKHENLLLEIHKQGHSIGNHTYSHAFLPMLSAEAMEKEILTTNQRIKDITGENPQFFRPPFGIVDKKTHVVLQEQEMKTVYWSAFSEDWRLIGEGPVVDRLAKYAAPGGIMILHELEPTGEQTIAATRSLIRKLKTRNFIFSALTQ